MSISPIENALRGYNEENRARFHTPSHKGHADVISLPEAALRFDVTELPETGSLFDGEGPIARAEELAARFFKTAGTFFSAGGCTLCMQAMLQMVARPGGKILAGRLIHRSAVHAMALLGLEPVWVWNRPCAHESLPGRVMPGDVADALKNNPDICAVYITSPDYYGVISDIAGIAEAAKPYNVPVIVDNAHGAHLRFVGEKLHPLDCGAAMSADSAHKTLPVLTGGAWLQVSASEFVPQVRNAMALFGSTSPSYLTMLSLDECRVWLEKDGEAAFARLREQVHKLKALAQIKGCGIPDGVCDPVRLSIETGRIGLTGVHAAELFRENGVEPEYADDRWVVFIPSPFNTAEDFLKLRSAISRLPVGTPMTQIDFLPTPPPKALPLRQAVLSPAEWVSLGEAAGRIAAETSCPCPPGIPMVMPGEMLTDEIIGFLSNYGISHIKVVK